MWHGGDGSRSAMDGPRKAKRLKTSRCGAGAGDPGARKSNAGDDGKFALGRVDGPLLRHMLDRKAEARRLYLAEMQASFTRKKNKLKQERELQQRRGQQVGSRGSRSGAQRGQGDLSGAVDRGERSHALSHQSPQRAAERQEGAQCGDAVQRSQQQPQRQQASKSPPLGHKAKPWTTPSSPTSVSAFCVR